jgi:hypothetical protein
MTKGFRYKYLYMTNKYTCMCMDKHACMDGERDLLNVKYEAIVSEFAPKLVSHVEHCIPYHAIKIKTNPHEKGKGKNKTLLHTQRSDASMVFYFGWWALTFHEPPPIRGNI